MSVQLEFHTGKNQCAYNLVVETKEMDSPIYIYDSCFSIAFWLSNERTYLVDFSQRDITWTEYYRMLCIFIDCFKIFLFYPAPGSRSCREEESGAMCSAVLFFLSY